MSAEVDGFTSVGAWVVEKSDGWHIKVQFDAGDIFLSEQAYPSQQDAEAAFHRWRVSIDAELLPVQ